MSKIDLLKDQGLVWPEKVQVMSRLLKQIPPGEFKEAFSDLRMLVGDDVMMCKEAASLYSMYNKDHFIPIKWENGLVLLTRHNELEENRFLDPENKVSFRYDPLRMITSNFQDHPEEDEKRELWRKTLYEALKTYVSNHYPEGVCSVFTKDTAVRKFFVACIESHRYKPLAFWNGLWKSEWIFAVVPASPSTEVSGSITVQTHYFEDGSVHLTVTKDVEETLLITDENQTAQDFVKLVEKKENELQSWLMEEYQLMNSTYVKSFRRQLPITHTSLDWEKVVTAKIVEAR